MSEKRKEPFTFEIIEHICVLASGREEGYQRELNYVSFNGKPPKWDIREWNAGHTKMTKGLNFTNEEMLMLVEAMSEKIADIGGCGQEAV